MRSGTHYIFTALFMLALWQSMIICFQLPNYILPSPYAVMQAFSNHAMLILQHAQITLTETLLGLSCGILLGASSALLLMYCEKLAAPFFPLLIVSQAIPTFAIAPLFVIWFGFGMASKIAIAMLMIFFPVCSAFYDGLRRVPTAWLELAENMQASRWTRLRYIMLPAALPSLASGIRLAAVAAPLGAIVGEWVGASQGLGYLMLNANARMQIDMMFAVLLFIILLSVVLYLAIDKLLRYYIWWQL